MTTTNTELIAEGRRQAKRYDKYLHSMSTWGRSTEHGKDTRMKAELLDLLADALESATTVTDEMVERASRAFYNDPIGLTNWDSLVKTSPEIAERYRVSVLRALTAALTQGERR